MPFRDLMSCNAGRLALSGTPHDLGSLRRLDTEAIAGIFSLLAGLMFYACQRLDGKTLVALQDLADEAGLVEDFMAMKSGVQKFSIVLKGSPARIGKCFTPPVAMCSRRHRGRLKPRQKQRQS